MKPGWAETEKVSISKDPRAMRGPTKAEADRKRTVGGKRGGRSRRVDRILAELPIDDGPEDLNGTNDWELNP